MKTIILSLLSVLSVLVFFYSKRDLEPWFYNSSWTLAKWPCYYWLANGLICILHCFWVAIKNNSILNKTVAILAKSSWEIYLMQMASIFLFKQSLIGADNSNVLYLFWFIIIWTLSIGGGFLLNKLFSKILY